MKKPNYWLNLFTLETWEEFLKSGGNISGFRKNRESTAKKIKKGDFFLCYLVGVSRFIGILEVTSECFESENPKIWKYDSFPIRLEVKIVSKLKPETAIPINTLKNELSIFENMKSPNSWTGHVRGSPTKWKSDDGEKVVKSVLYAEQNPIIREIDPKKLKMKTNSAKTKDGKSVTIPSDDEENDNVSNITPHKEIQWLLLKLGNDMGFDVWVARNDKGVVYKGRKFMDLPKILTELPIQFDDATNKTIELIDVLWLEGNTIMAAFEVESTTSIYSGLLRMSDLVSMQPNLKIPLYLVAPEDRREKVMKEVNRPTFSKLSPSLPIICRYMSFITLKKKLEEIQTLIPYLKPDFLEEISESCEIDEI